MDQVEDLDTLAIKSDSKSDKKSMPDSDEEGAKEKPTIFKKCTTEEHQKVMMLSNQKVVNKQLQEHEVFLDRTDTIIRKGKELLEKDLKGLDGSNYAATYWARTAQRSRLANHPASLKLR